MTARIVLDQEHPDREEFGALVEFAYCETLVDHLKALVPANERRWLPWSKQWWVAEEHIGAVTDLLVSECGELEVVDEDGCVEYRGRGGSVARQDSFL